jgi:hypothetical protein
MSFLRRRTVLGCSDFNRSLGEDSRGIYVWKAGLIHKLSVRSAMFALLERPKYDKVESRCCNGESDAPGVVRTALAASGKMMPERAWRC